jgi:hypothetical protein
MMREADSMDMCSPEKCHIPVCDLKMAACNHHGEDSCALSRHEREISMTCITAAYPPCSCCWDGVQPELPPLRYCL